MKQRYIRLMEMALSAYSDEMISDYIERVREMGNTEHGFPRLTANIGILIAHGIRCDLKPRFAEMMELCCRSFIGEFRRAANEFSVREIVLCLKEIEDAEVFDRETVNGWRKLLSEIKPEECYNVVVGGEDDDATNFAIFGAVSELARYSLGLGGDLDFVDRQLSCQFKWLDENMMYCDNKAEYCHQPMLYELLSRGLFALLLHLGYNGKYREAIDDCLRKSAILTLNMQSVSGEIPYGGRSAQFIHNEGWLLALLEYEANRCMAENDLALAAKYKRAAKLALDNTEYWLSRAPIRHVKNRFPTESGYGCESYAYFDKYMITAASNLFAAYLISNDSVPLGEEDDGRETLAFELSPRFHKVFLKCGEYFAELDTNADPKHDASGLGRVHKKGAPPAICISSPCPAAPKFKVDIASPTPLAICPCVKSERGWVLGSSPEANHALASLSADGGVAAATISSTLENGVSALTRHTVSEGGVIVEATADGEVGIAIPVFCFDGESRPRLYSNGRSLHVYYGGWVCKYKTNGKFTRTSLIGTSRCGHYRAYIAEGGASVRVEIRIEREA